MNRRATCYAALLLIARIPGCASRATADDGAAALSKGSDWLLAQQAAVAIEALDAGASGDDRAFYEGKVAVASFFAKNFLPLLTSTREVIETLDNDIMELDEAAF